MKGSGLVGKMGLRLVAELVLNWAEWLVSRLVVMTVERLEMQKVTYLAEMWVVLSENTMDIQSAATRVQSLVGQSVLQTVVV